MAKVEKQLSKDLYKIELYVQKMLPIVLAVVNVAHTIYSYFVGDCVIFSYIGGISLICVLSMYLTSYVFKFCEYHRMPLHYVVVSNLLATIDYHIGLPISDHNLFVIYMMLAGIAIILTIYLKFKPPVEGYAN